MVPHISPFVLLDDAREGGQQLLYRNPIDTIRADRYAQIGPAVARLRSALAHGAHAAGYLSYEAASAFDPALPAGFPPTGPLLWFGLFARREVLPPGAIATMLPDPSGAWAGTPRPTLDRERYGEAVAAVHALIAAGDIYQANLSFRASVAVAGHPLALYARLRRAAGAGWGGIVHDGTRWLLSCSPELFFELAGSRIVARPMKGTGPRGKTPPEDDALADILAADTKQRAENLMIVDLMRNDLARVAVPGSVRVPELFAIERYPTVQQMVSAVEADLAPGRDALDVLAALFPCGSVTGAPKRRAMEAIAEIEADARGVYTGAIGALAPDGGASFNVAIRTLVVEEGSDVATLGLGSAIVADSDAEQEWRECRAKSAFVTVANRPFDLIETLRFDPRDGLADLERHLARLKASADRFDFAIDRHILRNELHAATFRLTAASRVRLRLSPGGAIAIEASPMPAPIIEAAVAIVPLPVDPGDFRLAHKTSDRAFYDSARQAAGTFEILFRHPSGAISEGSFTHLFVPTPDGRLRTPPLTLGLLPGVLRARLIEEGRAIEDDVREEDLLGQFFVGNALRGLIPARLA